jgi:hypothetical protein
VRRGPLVALAVLALPFVVLVLVWALREPPTEPCSGTEPASVREAWLAGLAPAAFAAGCYCAAFVFWLSGRTRGGDPSRSTLLAVVALLAAAGVWWAGGETMPIVLWPALAYVLLIPSAVLVPGLVLAIVVSSEPRALALLRALAWWGGVVLLPGFVVAVDWAGNDIFC